jgi:restriction endonuclease Mrr
MDDLRLLPEYINFISRANNQDEQIAIAKQIRNSEATPEEILEASYQKIPITLAQELVLKIKASPPSFFKAWLSNYWLRWDMVAQ